VLVLNDPSARRGFAPIARLSYAINMLHFRLMMEIAFGDRTRTGLAALAAAGAGGGGLYLAVLPGVLWVASMAASVALAWGWHRFCDEHVRTFLESMLISRSTSVRRKAD
jgi:peptidoglycan/LPS O-acetylase OafA/YrhL